MMLLDLALLLSAASLATGASIPRQDPDILNARQDSGDPGLQDIPTTAKPDNTFSNGAAMIAGSGTTNETPPEVYGNRSIDLPFGRLYHGNMKFFSAGQLNTPTGDTDEWLPQGTDSATQSACGIPDNAYSISKVAIHPYFLKYVDLSRYCMQDVCISFWNEDGSSDMMLKVTDICSTDPNDPTSCATPADIKIDRTKAKIMEKLDSAPTGDVYPEQIWWFFMKCWDDGLVQPAYADNWFATPALPNNLEWAQATQHQQWVNNQISYPQQNPPLPLYFNGAYDTVRDNTTSPPIEDFDPNETYSWTPIAGGKGWGNPSGTASGTSNSSEAVASGSSAVATTSTQGSGQGSGQDGGVTPTTSAAVPAQSSSSGTDNGSEQDDCDEL
ncbi:hypothetical protein HO133_001926 [Letharia lupina]|uniref:Uncharacterized protein n=1 Tax=Letharia lupina TaxID=560253 RepID=A0A8H6FBN9_9LECA|nr:uncharacterized protein HO133_001926 [Letharia lupina]KAF6221958.1 hypothetical protein HO133_001926 [Letharia lupina]